jgi:endonuclease III
LSEKSQRLADLLAKVPASSAPLPNADGRTLLEVGFLCVLNRRLSESAAEKTLQGLAAAYPDWNELRVSQVQEFQHLIQTKSVELGQQVGRDVREYLQEIYQKIHGFNLDSLKGDMAEAARFASSLPFLGASVGHYLLHLALPDETPISPAVVRTLDRLGLAKRTTSIKKAQASVDALVPADGRKEFSHRLGLVIERWCDAKRPLCWECPLVPNCPFGKKVEREFKQAQRRLEVQRARDEERARKDAEKERRRVVAEEKRRVVAKAKLAAKAAAKKRPARRDAGARKKAAPKKRVDKKTAPGAARPKSSGKSPKKKGK